MLFYLEISALNPEISGQNSQDFVSNLESWQPYVHSETSFSNSNSLKFNNGD